MAGGDELTFHKLKHTDMINQQLLDYIKQQLQKGAPKETIKNTLVAKGWQAQDVEQAFGQVSPSSFGPGRPDAGSPSLKAKKRTRPALVSVLFLFFLGAALVGGAVFGYYSYFLQSPEQIIAKAVGRMAEVRSLEYSGKVTMEIAGMGEDIFQLGQPSLGQQDFRLIIDFAGAVDMLNQDDPRSSTEFRVSADDRPEESLTLGITTISAATYVIIKEVPDLGFFDLSSIKNQWIKIDVGTLERTFGLTELKDQLKVVKKDGDLSPEQIKQLEGLASEVKIFKNVEKLPDEKIDGLAVYHFRLAIDKNEALRLITRLSMIIQDKPLDKEALAKLDGFLAEVELTNSEVWIGKKDLLARKILLEAIVKKTDKPEGAGSKLTLLAQFKNFNSSFKIEAPARVRTLEEVLGRLLEGLFGEIK